jgi:hypothetical protein
MQIWRDHAGMTKAENRAAAKADKEEKERKWWEEAHAAAVAADLVQLAALRTYLIFGRKAGVSADSLIKAIDDYVENLTGDRRALHAQHHSNRRSALKFMNGRPYADHDSAARRIM